MLVNLIRVPDPTSIDDHLDEPLGLLYLGAALRQVGFDVKVTDGDFVEADVYGIQLYTSTAHRGIRIAKHIKQLYPWALTVAGGAHPTAVQEGLTVFDIVIRGEGEISFPMVVNYYNGHFELQSLYHSSMHDLDSIPFPARDLVDIMSYHRKVDGHRCFGIIGQRGCGYKCTFCDRSLFGNKARYRSIGNIVEEIQQCIDTYGVRHYEFFDDIPFPTVKRIKEFQEKTKGMNLEYRCNSRPDTKKNIFKLMEKTGCKMVCFGIESGVQFLLDKMQKGTTVKENLKAIHMAKEEGLDTMGYFILGFPGETKDTIKQTMEFVDKSELDQAQFYTFIPLPGCEAYIKLEEYGAKLISTDYSDYYHVTGSDGHGGKTIDTPSLSADELQEEMQKVRKWLRERKSKGEMQDYYKEKLGYDK